MSTSTTPTYTYYSGTDHNDELMGSDGDDIMDGLAGADRMTGRKGNDLYWVDNPGDVVIENAGEGFDTVVSRITEYNLPANVEVLLLQGDAYIGRGNNLDNTILGTAGNNWIDGLAGADTMVGGDGNDAYLVDNPGDAVIEYADEGFDSVISRFLEYNLPANVEVLLLQGDAYIGRGNELDNRIWGTAGNNLIDGLAGADTMTGLSGNDYYWVDNPGDAVIELAGEGTADRVVSRIYEYNLPANVERLDMEGGAFIGRGNALDNIIVGTAGDNLIDGLGGADTMMGGAGNDWYGVDNPGDVVVENAGQGTTDRVVSRITEYNLAANVEELSMEDNAVIGRGNDLNNTIWGTTGDNLIDGLGGADTMMGGAGNDHYWIDNPGDVVIENASQGIADRVVSRITEYNLAANVEELSMEGNAFLGRGNDLDNTIWGTAGINHIDGLGGADTMAGGGDDDWYWVDNPGDVVIENAGQGREDRVVSQIYEYNLPANVERLDMEGGAFIGRGNALDNIIVGTAGNNLIDGLGGADTMAGGDGNDHYWIDNPGDRVVEFVGQGTADRVVSRIYEYNLDSSVEELSMEDNAFIGRGNELNNTIWGTAGNNLIDGLAGADTMAGGAGNDHYWIDNPGDIVLENAGEGTADRVVSRVSEYNLAANVEELFMEGNAFIGRGNNLNNWIVGTAGDNLIDGRAGADITAGGAGNDTYWVDNPGDVVIENAGQGLDTVLSPVYEYNLPANVEVLIMENGAFIGRGNDLDNDIWGTAGDDRIDGLGGADTMRGDGGNDHYWIDNPGDVVIETAGQDTADRVVSRIYEYKLAENVEELFMEGNAFIGRGNNLNNWIVGTAGNNLIDGLGGADTMIGGPGSDTYLFARGDGADRIIEDDATAGSTDVLQFQGSISADQIWLRQLGNDLEASVIGTSDKITIENWYAGNQYHVEQIKSSDGRTLLDGSVNNLVQAMAAFAPPGPGQAAMPGYATALAPVIAANWF